LKLTETSGDDSAAITAFAADLNDKTLTISTGTMQAVFQAGANTRDAFTVTGFKDIRLFDIDGDDIKLGAKLEIYEGIFSGRPTTPYKRDFVLGIAE
jgi:hypothetical protein